MRRAAAAAVVLLLLTLAGCSLLVRHDVAEGPLRDRIGDLASVTDVTSSVDRTFGRTIWVTVDSLVEKDLQAIVANADDLLAHRDATFNISYRNENLLVLDFPDGFSAKQVAGEVHYWLRLSIANRSPLGMLLQQSDGPYRNIWQPDQTDEVDWNALRAVPDPSKAEHSYYLDDIVATNVMPPPDITALRDRLAALGLEDDETLELVWTAPGFLTVRYSTPDAGRADPTSATSWPRAQEIVSEFAEMGLQQSSFVYSTKYSERGASLYLGDCTKVAAYAGWKSPELVAALIDSGVKFPDGVHPGYCDDSGE